MELYFIRHAIAIDRDAPDAPGESERWLTENGIQKMIKNARGLNRLIQTFDCMYTSPYRRAKETAEIVAGQFREPILIEETAALEPDGTFDELPPLIEPYDPNGRVALVGHEPHLSETIALAIADSTNPSIQLKKGAVCRVDFSGPIRPGQGTLVWLLQPKELRTIAR